MGELYAKRQLERGVRVFRKALLYELAIQFRRVKIFTIVIHSQQVSRVEIHDEKIPIHRFLVIACYYPSRNILF